MKMTEIIQQIQKEINNLYCEMGFISKTEVNKIFDKYYKMIKENKNELDKRRN